MIFMACEDQYQTRRPCGWLGHRLCVARDARDFRIGYGHSRVEVRRTPGHN